RPYEQDPSRRRLAQRGPEIGESQTALDRRERRPVGRPRPEREGTRLARPEQGDRGEHAREPRHELAARQEGPGPAEASRHDERDPRAVDDTIGGEPAQTERLEREPVDEHDEHHRPRKERDDTPARADSTGSREPDPRQKRQCGAEDADGGPPPPRQGPRGPEG